MKLGILNAIPPAESRVNWKGSPVDAYIRFVESAAPGFDYEGYGVAQGELPDSPEACDAYLITGSPKGVYDSDGWIAALSEFIRESYRAGTQLVGICFGHQILAHALGGRAEKSEKGWGIGLKSIAIEKSRDWMVGAPDRCSLYFVHQDQVIDLPPGAELLGGSPFCPNAFYTIADRVLSIQGHPELTAEIMRDVLANLKHTVQPEMLSAAAESIESGTPDNQLVAQWIVNFLKAA